MTQQSNECSRGGSRWPIVLVLSAAALVSATTLVVAGPPWASKVFTGAASPVSQQSVHATHQVGSKSRSIDVDDGYVKGLAKAVPGLVIR